MDPKASQQNMAASSSKKNNIHRKWSTLRIQGNRNSGNTVLRMIVNLLGEKVQGKQRGLTSLHAHILIR